MIDWVHKVLIALVLLSGAGMVANGVALLDLRARAVLAHTEHREILANTIGQTDISQRITGIEARLIGIEACACVEAEQ